LGQERDIDERRSGHKNGSRTLHSDIEKDVARAGNDEIGREPKDPEGDPFGEARASLLFR
jgi:hypothetical protein